MEPSSERIYDDKTTTFAQATFGWSLEDIGMQIQDMAGGAKETTYSMGDDAPLAALSERPHPTYNYFKQRFAQVGKRCCYCCCSSEVLMILINLVAARKSFLVEPWLCLSSFIIVGVCFCFVPHPGQLSANTTHAFYR